MIDFTRRVQVFYNLHKHTFSVRQGGRVVLHTDSIDLFDVRFTVRNAGRLKVLATGQKNVHAFVTGRALLPGGPERAVDYRHRVTYNPYRYTSFVDVDTGEAIYDAPYVALRNKAGKPSILVG